MHNEVLEELTVVKRSGQRVSFNASKVAIAIKNAFDSVGNIDEKKIFKVFEKVLTYINENYRDRKTINVEDIQDIIEKVLYSEKQFLVHNAFKEYRQKRALSRKVFSEKQQHKFIKAIEKIEETSLNKNNKSADDLIYDFGRIISCEYTKYYVLDTKSSRASEEGNIYIHDLDYFSLGMIPNIHLSITDNVQSDYDIDVLINNIINVEREVCGEIVVNNFDEVIEGYLLEKYKQKLIYHLNKYLELSGFLALINFKKVVDQIKSEKSIQISNQDYNQYFPNEQLRHIFIYALKDAEEYIEALCKRTVDKVFLNLEQNNSGKSTYTISMGRNRSLLGCLIAEKVYDAFSENKYLNIHLIIKTKDIDAGIISTIARILEKNNIIALNFDKDDIEYTFDGIRIYENNNSNESTSIGRMVVSSTSINLARLGLKYKNKNKSDFYTELDNLCELVKNELLLSFETIGAKNKEYYKYLFNGNVYDDEKLEPGQKIRKVIKNGLLNIGIIGLKECAIALEPDESKRVELIFEIIEFINHRIEKYSQETKLNFGLYEPVCKKARTRLLAIDKAVYGMVTDVTDKKRYDLLDISILEKHENLSKLQNKLKSGKCIIAEVSGKTTIKKLVDIIEPYQNNKISFLKIRMGKNED